MKNVSNIYSTLSSKKGFTLVELLVVIAVLGVLAAGVLVAINPVEQLARGRDSAKKTAVAELGRGLLAYQTSQNQLPDGIAAGTTWADVLITSGDIKVKPTNPAGPSLDCTFSSSSATQGHDGGYCYMADHTTGRFVVFARAESLSEEDKAAGTATECPGSDEAWIVFASRENKVGLLCDVQGDINEDVTGLL